MLESSDNQAPQGEPGYRFNDAWDLRWRQLEDELRGSEYPATPEDLERCKAELVGKYNGEAAKNDGLIALTMKVASDPIALMSYYQDKARYADIEARLAAEGLTPPRED